jgi:tungstate transport system ATP-binding protein
VTLVYSVSDLVFSYDGPVVLEVAHLEILQGEVVALVGPNGAGKTSLLHLLAFLQAPNRGGMLFCGEAVTRERILSFRRRVGLLLQIPYLFHSTVLENVMWGLRIRHIPRAKCRRMAGEALERVGLSGFERRHARSLSGGETQRVALARALVLEPEVLLLDEPGSHMDRESVLRTEEIVLRLNRDQGTTIVFTTHDQAQAQALGHRVLRLSQGRLASA